MSTKTKVCIVGAGSAGLVTLKESLAEGFQPTCYELWSDIGGLWDQKPDPQTTPTPMVWDSLFTNTPKNVTAYSDFPFPPEQTPYMTRKTMKKYFDSYADHFGLRKYICLNTRVVKVRKSVDHDATGRWDVYTAPTSKPANQLSLESCKKEVFDVVYICPGFMRDPVYPKVKGLDNAKIPVSHSYHHKNSEPYRGKTVLVVGNSLSAADVAEDIVGAASQVYLAVGRGTWLMPRLVHGGIPIMEKFTRKLVYHRDSEKLFNEMLMETALQRLDHDKVKMRPPTIPLKGPWCLGESLQSQIMSGKVKICGYLDSLDGRTARFTDGSAVEGLDAVVCCTGFKPNLDFLDESFIQENGRIDMYHMMYPLNWKHNTLVFVGHISADTSFPVIAEIMARLATKVTSGNIQLPSQEAMKQNADFLNEANLQKRGSYSYFLPGFAINEPIAKQLGVFPSFWKLFFKDPCLAYRVWYGPVYSCHYRLLGPGSNWEAARKQSHRAYEESGMCTSGGIPLKELMPTESTYNKVRRAFMTFGLPTIVVVGAVAASACLCQNGGV